jgi:hypothetical protein
MMNRWVYCEGGPKEGMHLGEGEPGAWLIFDGLRPWHYYRITDRTQNTKDGPVPVAVFDRSE